MRTVFQSQPETGQIRQEISVAAIWGLLQYCRWHVRVRAFFVIHCCAVLKYVNSPDFPSSLPYVCVNHIADYTMNITFGKIHTYYRVPYTIYSILQNVHCTLHNAQSIVNNEICTIHTAYFTAHWSLHTAHYALHIAHYKLQTAYCRLHPAAQFEVFSGQCIVKSVQCCIQFCACV